MSIIRQWGAGYSSNDRRVNHAKIAVVVPPVYALEPASLDEVRRYTRVDFTQDDPLLPRLLSAARQRVEAYLRRSLLTQTIELTLDWGPAWVELPRPPIQSVTSIIVKALDQSDTTANPNSYFFNQAASLVGLLPSAIWPTHITPAGWRCRYVAGFGDTMDDVPDVIWLSILNLVAMFYDKRGEDLSEIDKMAIRQYRIEGPPFRMAKGLEPPELLA